MMRDELKDRAIALLKDAYAIGYEDGVKATNVDFGVVWEERIDAIKAEIQEVGYAKDEYGSIRADVLKVCQVLSIIDKHCVGENE